MASMITRSLLVLIPAFNICGQMLSAIPNGFAIAGQEAMLCGPAGRSGTGSVSAVDDSIGRSASFSYTNSLGRMDAGPGGDFQSLAIGASVLRPSFRIQTRVIICDALGIWREASLHVSAGPIMGRARLSLDTDIGTVGIVGDCSRRDISVTMGGGLYVRGRRLCAGISPSIPLSDDGEGGASRFSRAHVDIRAAAAETKIGAPGILLRISDFEYPRFGLVVAEQLRLGDHLTCAVSVATVPVSIGIGIIVHTGAVSTAVSGLRSPLLGWSEGLAVEHHRD